MKGEKKGVLESSAYRRLFVANGMSLLPFSATKTLMPEEMVVVADYNPVILKIIEVYVRKQESLDP